MGSTEKKWQRRALEFYIADAGEIWTGDRRLLFKAITCTVSLKSSEEIKVKVGNLS